jgi:N,N'-diacetyllegionaminate synthase
MSTLEEISAAIEILIKSGAEKDNITVLHCNSEYPTPMNDVNLLAMKSMADFFGLKVGYSDHTMGIEVPIAAVALGASVIEKHITVDKKFSGPDHRASIEPNEFEAMVKSIRNIQSSLGDNQKFPTKSELKNKIFVRKSIVAGSDIKKGEVFSEKNLTVKRPGKGICPMRWDEIIGVVANKNYEKDELIQL